MIEEIREIEDLLFYVEFLEPSIIVVEGYNGVGKSRVLEFLSSKYGTGIYRPSYDNWAKLLPASYRWAIFASFVDVVKQLRLEFQTPPLLFDRGFFSGVVYNDPNLADYYKSVAGDLNILHILVTCSEDSYSKFLSVRSSDKDLKYEDCFRVTGAYRSAMSRAGAHFVEFLNIYDEKIGRNHQDTCRGCSHYNIGDSCCKNPVYQNKRVSPDTPRCENSAMREVQDLGELQTMSPQPV